MLKITLQCDSKNRHIPSTRELQQWAKAVFNERAPEGEITLRIINPKESAQLNETYRGKAGPTNVLAFDYQITPIVVGDIALCAPLIAKQAREQKKAPKAHWAHLVVHSCLHLLGYDHIKKQETKVMETLEIEILKQLGFPNPYEA